MMDEFSRYEVGCEIKDEVAAMEIALMESTWMKNFGYPKRLRTDASGPHQGWVLQWSGPAGPRRYGPCGGGPREPACARRAREPAEPAEPGTE